MAGEALTASALIACAEAAGVRMRLGEDGAVMLEADRPPPPALLAAMRRRAAAGRARVERHYGVDVAVFEPTADAPDDAPGLIASALPAAIRIAEAAAERAAPPAEAGPREPLISEHHLAPAARAPRRDGSATRAEGPRLCLTDR